MNCLYRWSQLWQLKFNISTCKHLHFGPAQHQGFYYLYGIPIDTVTSHNDLGILFVVFDDKLKFHDYTAKVTTKANRILSMIKKSFEYLDSGMLSKLFTTLVRPILEYSNAIWGSLFTLDQRKVEKVQRRATHLLPSLHDKSYTERLSLLSLPSLLYRYQKGDLKFLTTTSALILLIYTPTPLLLPPGGTSLSCSSTIQDCYADLITL